MDREHLARLVAEIVTRRGCKVHAGPMRIVTGETIARSMMTMMPKRHDQDHNDDIEQPHSIQVPCLCTGGNSPTTRSD